MSLLTLHHSLVGMKKQEAGEFVIIGGLKYRTVTIGSQTWMAENLQLAVGNAPFYNNDEATYGRNGYNNGRLYTWEQAKSIIVNGWHLPTKNEFGTLLDAVGGKSIAGAKLKSTTQWSSGISTDDYGFAVYPSGWSVNNAFSNFGSEAKLWSANEENYLNGVACRFTTGNYVFTDEGVRKTACVSVRLVKDA